MKQLFHILRSNTSYTVSFFIIASIILIFCSSCTPELGVAKGPILTTKWSQHGEYKVLTPVNASSGQHERLGCWSTAIAQMIKLLQMQPHGNQYYEGTHYTISEDLNHVFDFSKMPDILDAGSTVEEKTETSLFCYTLAVIVRKDFGTDSYMGNSDSIRQELESHFNCNTERVTTSMHAHADVEDFIVDELNANRACMLYAESTDAVPIGHAMVIDGYNKTNTTFEVHINFGWGGLDDGWYALWEEIPATTVTFDSYFRWIMSIVPL